MNSQFRPFFKNNSPAQAYSGLLQLITLDLSKNNLTWIPPGDEKYLNKCKYFYNMIG